MGRRTTVAPEDLDLLSYLDALDQRLYLLIHHARKYRTLIRVDLTRLRQGAAPGPIRAGLEPWAGVLREMKRLAREI